jgi:hypothetical protein
MQGKLALAAGFAAGYVLGSKAGRQRYEEIVAQARRLAGNQTVQSTAGVLQAQATDLVNKAKQSDLVNKAVQTVKGRDQSAAETRTTHSTPSAAPSTDIYEPVTTPTVPPDPTSSTRTNGSMP